MSISIHRTKWGERQGAREACRHPQTPKLADACNDSMTAATICERTILMFFFTYGFPKSPCTFTRGLPREHKFAGVCHRAQGSPGGTGVRNDARGATTTQQRVLGTACAPVVSFDIERVRNYFVMVLRARGLSCPVPYSIMEAGFFFDRLSFLAEDFGRSETRPRIL